MHLGGSSSASQVLLLKAWVSMLGPDSIFYGSYGRTEGGMPLRKAWAVPGSLLVSIQLLAPSKLLLVSMDFAHVLRGRAEHGPAVKHWLGLLGKSRQHGGLGLDC